jgi:glycosyltransferase involved in cell wall biosynthesis
MKIIHISHSDANSGAFIAAYRIHKALEGKGINSEMWVDFSSTKDYSVFPFKYKFKKIIKYIQFRLIDFIFYFFKTENKVFHSPSIFNSGIVSKINRSGADIVNLHWVQYEMISIKEISKIRIPIVWTLHDMWAFCGAEHYTDDLRWQEGYFNKNRPRYEKGLDLNKWVWKRKLKNWKKPFTIVSPSYWLYKCSLNSVLFNNFGNSCIPNPIDTFKWQPINKVQARNMLNLPMDSPLILFGAAGGGNDPRKGFDLLCEALNFLNSKITNVELVIFGQYKPENEINLDFPTHYMGHLHDEISLKILYSAADVMIIPSRQDNLPNTGIESHACGTPVVAFDIGGLSDIVEHKVTGYLAKPFDTLDMAEGINWVLTDIENLRQLSTNASKRANDLWNMEVIGRKYLELYDSILKKQI